MAARPQLKNRFYQSKYAWLAGLGLALAAGCGRGAPPAVTVLPATVTATLSAPAATGTSVPTETVTASPQPSATPSDTATSTPSPTPTPHPMSIVAMRQRDYSGSDIVIESELEPGSNYSRYYASYLSEDLKIYALLTIPNGDPPPNGWPVIVFHHGYIPPTQYRTTSRYVAYVDRLAQAGYIVFRSDYRGHDQSEGVAQGAYGNPGYVVDVLNAVASLKRFPQANPERIGMWGHSLGGYITLRSMVISPDIKAGVIWGGVVAPYPDLFARGNVGGTPTTPQTPSPGGRGWRGSWVQQYGTPEENPDFWNGISANSFLNDLSGPIQLHHAVTDETVPVAASETLFAELQAAGEPSELYTYPGDNHNLSGFFTTAMNRSIEFFDLYLK
ncbi:MAG TPA: alpha/beta fold hydrolase [Chloroflexia bacterium]|nr:alpha/beta fold hydrolase [Chloroflexia bacterium]